MITQAKLKHIPMNGAEATPWFIPEEYFDPMELPDYDGDYKIPASREYLS